MSGRGKYTLRRIIKAAIEDAGGEIAEDPLVKHLASLGYHGPSVRRVLPILDPLIVYEDGILRVREWSKR